MNSSHNQNNIETTATQSAKPLKGRSLNNVKFIGVLTIFCALFLASVFIFDTVFSTSSTSTQISLASNKVSSVNEDMSANQNKIMVETANNLSKTQSNISSDDAQVDAVQVGSSMSETDFRQEAQNIIRRDSDSNILSLDRQVANLSVQAISNNDFRVEADNVLYRDEL